MKYKINQKLGRLTIVDIEEVYELTRAQNIYICRCDCGKMIRRTGKYLSSYKPKECTDCTKKAPRIFGNYFWEGLDECKATDTPCGHPVEFKEGHQIDQLTIQKYIGKFYHQSMDTYFPFYKCKCTCGQLVYKSQHALKRKEKNNRVKQRCYKCYINHMKEIQSERMKTNKYENIVNHNIRGWDMAIS